MSQREPVRLRDVQRALAREHSYHPASWLRQAVRQLVRAGVLSSSSASSADDRRRLQAEIDRLTARYGSRTSIQEVINQHQHHDADADAPLTQGEARPKGTAEWHPATSHTSQETHGGDGRSGEVPDGHSQSGTGLKHAPPSSETATEPRTLGQQPLMMEAERCSEDSGSGGYSSDQKNNSGQNAVDHHVSVDSLGESAEKRMPAQAQVAAVETGQRATPQSERVQQGQPHSSAPADEPSSVHDTPTATTGAEPMALKKDGAESGEAPSSASRTTLVEGEGDNDHPCGVVQKQAGEHEGQSSENIPSRTVNEARSALQTLRLRVGPSSRTPRKRHGGITAVLERAGIEPRLVREASAVLAQWMAADGTNDEQSHRWDYPHLSARLVTKRSPYPARKEELGRPILLVLADVSRSCAGFSQQALLVARAIGTQGLPGCDILVVSHSNGKPEECELNGRPLPAAQHRRYAAIRERTLGDDHWENFAQANMAFYEAMIADYAITHVIALGDHDAADVYTMLAESPSCQQVLWLDNYACNWHAPRLDDPGTLQGRVARSKTRYVTGCKDAAAFVQGLRVALQGE